MTQKTFGEAIAEARKVLRLSQKELAVRVLKEDGTSITPQYLNDIEHDRRNPTSDHMIAALARALDQKPEYLFLLAGRMQSADVRKAATAGPERVSEAMLAFRKTLSGTRKP